MKKLVSFLLILLSLTLVVGCSDEAQVKSAAKKMVSAMKSGNLDKAMKLAPKDVREQMGKMDKKELEEIKKEFKEDVAAELKGAKFSYGDVKINGDKATIEVTMTKDGKDDTDEIEFEKEDGKWVVSDFDF